jgi:hypothetical protein
MKPQRYKNQNAKSSPFENYFIESQYVKLVYFNKKVVVFSM